MATPRGSDVVRDLKFTNNTIKGGTTGFYFIGTDDRSHSLTPIVSRIIFDNNIFTDLDGYRVSNPHDDAVTPAYCGYPLYLHGASETLIVTHNLFDRSRGARTQTFAFSNGRGSGLQIRNNILWYTNDENEGPLWKPGYNAATSSGKPNAAGSVRQVFDTLWSHSSFMNNIVIPGVKSTLDPDRFDSFSASDTMSHSDCANYFEGFPSIYCGGNPLGLSTAKQNVELVKFVNPNKGNFRLKGDSPARAGSQWKLDGSLAVSTMVTSSDGKDIGPDHDALERAQGKVDNFRIVNVTSTEALVAYVAPDTKACAVDFAPAAFPAPTVTPQRVSDGGGDDLNRNVMLTGLTAGTTYHVRVQCAAEQPYGLFETKNE
jgi:hypothetical protein